MNKNLSELEIKLAAIEALTHALYCKKCQKSYEKILGHNIKIYNKIADAMLKANKQRTEYMK